MAQPQNRPDWCDRCELSPSEVEEDASYALHAFSRMRKLERSLEEVTVVLSSIVDDEYAGTTFYDRYRAIIVAAEDLLKAPWWPPEPAKPVCATCGGRKVIERPSCVEQWPECTSFGYDPRCCRFPKSCSSTMACPDCDPW